MPTSSLNKRPQPWLRYSIAAIAAGSIFAAFLYWRSGDTQDTPPSSEPHAATDVFGPGVLNGSDNNASLAKQENAAPALMVPGRLTVAADQQLVIDTGLLDVMNFFLLEQAGTDRGNALQNYLKAKLPPAAYSEASAIASHYQAYMKAYDSLLQGQNLGAEDISTRAGNIGRLITWREQRDRLRLSLLGENVVKAWYQNDDAELNQVLNELQQRIQSSAQANGNATSGDTDANEQHEQDMQRVLTKATKSFSALAQEGKQWAMHFTAFQAAVSQMPRTDANSFEREHQIQLLLEKMFPTDEERQRARDQIQ